MKKRNFALITAAALCSAAIAGCGTSPEPAAKETAALSSAESAVQSSVQSDTEPAEFTYPMAPGETITWWHQLSTTASANFSNMGDTPFGKALMEQTGTEIEFMHPPTGQIQEQFSLIIADGNKPDIMEYNWLTDYPGGPEKAIKDGVIIALNDVFEQYCPNLTAYLKAHPDIDRIVKTDNGVYYAFPFVRGVEELCSTTGLIVRQDWLDELGMEIPTTVDEWHTALTAFKEQKGIPAPYCPQWTRADLMIADPFMAPFQISKNFFIGNDGKVHYGPAEESYKDYLALMAQWYDEGLIDQNIATLGFDQVSANMTNGNSGLSVGFAGSYMGTWISAAQSAEPDYMLSPAPFPTLNKGETPEFGYFEQQYSGRGSAAITTSCKDVERVARLLDYGYSEAGNLLFNFGVEGESYTMVDGVPSYTDWILNNPDGWPIGQALGAYIRGNNCGPFIQDLGYLEQYYTLQSQKDSVTVWGKGNAKAHSLPPITPSAEESKELATIMNEINTYRDEMTLKFIFGTESLDHFDQYLENIKSMGLERALEIQNAALERFNAR